MPVDARYGRDADFTPAERAAWLTDPPEGNVGLMERGYPAMCRDWNR